ncbi:MAG: hypothetical protein MUP82_04635, partial [Candidatus Marinimicrobia bacterium]|nr:hypothetical protein [Candidatus Neomarinimicrobiota bacterium]
MKKFFFKIIIFVVPFFVILNIPKITHYIFKDEIKAKINMFVTDFNEPMIIIGGDSRAERQIIPKIIEERFGISTINIGVSAGDIGSYYNALYEYDLINKDVLGIISVSSIEINDNVVGKWGIPHAYVTYISLFDNIKLFGWGFPSMMLERFRLIFEEIFTNRLNYVLNDSDSRIETKGFLGISGDITRWEFDEINLKADTLKVGWYLNSNHNGACKRTFNKIIKKIASSDMNIVLIQPPVSPSWYQYTSGTFIDSIELDHSKYLKYIASKYDNISF